MRTTLESGVLTVAMDRPERMNALTAGEMAALQSAIAVGANASDVRVIVLTGDGPAFCSGADLDTTDELADGDMAAAIIDAANELVATITACPKPVVAVARGAVAGVGVPIALSADLVLCDDRTYFMLAFTKVGLMPDGGASAIVAAAIGRAKALRLALLAERLPAVEAEASGLVSHVWPVDEFDSHCAQVIAQLAEGPQAAFRETKAAINAATLTSLPAAFQRERAGQIGLLGAADFAEGSAAFRERRRAVFVDA
jgi:enoyl-CoA hydratase